MNALEVELWIKRLKNPIENWDKIVEVARAITSHNYYDPRYSHLERCAELRRAFNGSIIANLYEEAWRNPEKIVFFKDNAIDMADLMTYEIARSTITNACLLADCSTAITTDSVLSYIALKEHGFRIRTGSDPRRRHAEWWRFGWWDAVNIVAVTKAVLTPSVLFPILESDMTRVEKMKRLNGLLYGYSRLLRNLIAGRPEDNRQVEIERLRRDYDVSVRCSSPSTFNAQLIVTYTKLALMGCPPEVKPPTVTSPPSDRERARMESLGGRWIPFDSRRKVKQLLFGYSQRKPTKWWGHDNELLRLCELVYAGYIEVKRENNKAYVRYRLQGQEKEEKDERVGDGTVDETGGKTNRELG